MQELFAELAAKYFDSLALPCFAHKLRKGLYANECQPVHLPVAAKKYDPDFCLGHLPPKGTPPNTVTTSGRQNCSRFQQKIRSTCFSLVPMYLMPAMRDPLRDHDNEALEALEDADPSADDASMPSREGWRMRAKTGLQRLGPAVTVMGDQQRLRDPIDYPIGTLAGSYKVIQPLLGRIWDKDFGDLEIKQL